MSIWKLEGFDPPDFFTSFKNIKFKKQIILVWCPIWSSFQMILFIYSTSGISDRSILLLFELVTGAAFSTQVRVGIFRTKVDLRKLKCRNRIQSCEGAEYSTQVSAPSHNSEQKKPSHVKVFSSTFSICKIAFVPATMATVAARTKIKNDDHRSSMSAVSVVALESPFETLISIPGGGGRVIGPPFLYWLSHSD